MGQNCPLGTLFSHVIRSCTLKPREILRTSRIEQVISQPRFHGSLLPVPTSQGRVGENPGNEVGNFPPFMAETHCLSCGQSLDAYVFISGLEKG